ncbi:MAG: hypothetical protein OEV94_08175 [Deltaproteobacteria bacterium]|nr:hypothetical protein [Deltaproteobacteria bacterium]
MVEQGVPESLIPGQTEPSLPPLPSLHGGGDILRLDFLIQSLDHPDSQVAMWAAYTLVERHQEQVHLFLDRLVASPLDDVRESGVNLAGKLRLSAYGFPLLRLFLQAQGEIKASAAAALGRLAYAPAEKALLEYFEQSVLQAERNLPDLEAAAQALLDLNPERHWKRVAAQLAPAIKSHPLFTSLYRVLSRHATTGERMAQLAQAYQSPRKLFHDFNLVRHLMELTGRPNTSRHLQARLNHGLTLPEAYREALGVLGLDEAMARAEEEITALRACAPTAEGVAHLLECIPPLLRALLPGDEEAERLIQLAKGCQAWTAEWDEAILKVREMEYHFLAALPLTAALKHAEHTCLEKPEAHALTIAQIYRSPMLSPSFMRRVLGLMAVPTPDGHAEPDGEGPPEWLWDDEKEALWKLFSGQLEKADYPFEQVLPQPWNYQIPGLMERLARLLERRLPYFLNTGRRKAVDYTLEVLRRAGQADAASLLAARFDPLMIRHRQAFLEFISHLPDRRFLAPLVRHTREYDPDQDRLIRFIAAVHGLQAPALPEPAQPRPLGANPTTARLVCPSCHSVYHYLLQEVYVSLDRVEQRQIPREEDIWLPAPLVCKNCHETVPFHPDLPFLQELYADILNMRMIHLNHRDNSGPSHLHLIAFPHLDGKPVHPALFLADVQQALAHPDSLTPARRALLQTEAGKLYLEMGNREKAREAFQDILTGSERNPAALYHLGLIAFQEKNLHDARVYFSLLVQSCARESFEKDAENPVDLAQHYLRLLDRPDYKRTQFRLISSDPSPG